MALEKALADLRLGKIIAVYDGDGREGEADALVLASHCTQKTVEKMRTKAGGLLCLAVNSEVAGTLGLPFMADLLFSDDRMVDMIYNRTKYGDKPAFSISINHADAKTGISDDDRSKTMMEFAKMLELPKSKWRGNFIKNFRTPGHVNLLISRDIKKRNGHTEMSIELARMANAQPAVALCEITGNRKEMSHAMAEKIARQNKWLFIEGSEIGV